MKLAGVRIYNSFYHYQFIPAWCCSECGFEFGETEIHSKFTVKDSKVCPLCGRELDKSKVVRIVDTHKIEGDQKKRFEELKAKFGTHGCKAVAAMLDERFVNSDVEERVFGSGWEFNADFDPFPDLVPFMFAQGMVPKTINGEEFESLRIYVHSKKIAEKFVPLLDPRFGRDTKAIIKHMYGTESEGKK